jgi:integrase
MSQTTALTVVPPVKYVPPRPSPEMTTLEFFKQVYLLERELRRNSIYQFTRSLRALDEFMGRDVRLCDLCPELVNLFIIARSQEKSARTAMKNRGDILCLWRMAYHHELVEFLPRGIRKAKYVRKVPRAFTAEQYQAILEAAANLTGRYVYDPALPVKQGSVARSLWWGAFIRTAYDTALRRADLLALKRGDIGDDGKIVIPIGKTQIEHYCQVRPETLAAIDATYPPVRECIFQWTCAYTTLWRHWEEILDAVGLPKNRDHGLHCLRRTSATYLETVSPGAAGRHLGHLTPGLAEKHYIDPRICGADRQMLPPDIAQEGGADAR